MRQFDYFDFTSSQSSKVLYTVPAGKRLVIEFFTARWRGSQNPYFSINAVVNGSAITHGVGRVEPQSIVAGPIRLYADGGTDVTVKAEAGAQPGSDARGEFTFAGYLLDVP